VDEVLAQTDNREDTEADDVSSGVLDAAVDCEGDLDVETELLDVGDKILDTEFIGD